MFQQKLEISIVSVKSPGPGCVSSGLATLSGRPPQLQHPAVLIIPEDTRGCREHVCLLLKSPACAAQDDGRNQDSPGDGANDDVGAAGTWGGGQGSVGRGRHGEGERQSPTPASTRLTFIFLRLPSGQRCGQGVVDTAVFACPVWLTDALPFVATDLEVGWGQLRLAGPCPVL